MFNRNKKKKKKATAPQRRGPGRPPGVGNTPRKRINTQFFEFTEDIPEKARRRKSAREGTHIGRIIDDFMATDYTRGFLTADQLDLNPTGMGGLVAAVNRHAKRNNYRIYARLICGLIVLERSNRKATQRSQKVGA